jgi:hypothetical protein
VAKVSEITLDGKTNWQGVADDARRMLLADEPQHLSSDDWKELVSSHSPKSSVVLTMDTRQTYGQMLERPLAEKKARDQWNQDRAKAKKKGDDIGDFDATWFNVQFFVKGWSGLLDPDDGSELPFTFEGMKRADVADIAQIVDLVTKVSNGIDPNG